jgi:hypothetical protein
MTLDTPVWAEAHAHVDMIRSQMPFQDLGLLLHGQRVEDFPEMPAYGPLDRPSARLGDEGHMMLAIPLRVLCYHFAFQQVT